MCLRTQCSKARPGRKRCRTLYTGRISMVLSVTLGLRHTYVQALLSLSAAGSWLVAYSEFLDGCESTDVMTCVFVVQCSDALGDRKTDGTFCSTICMRCLHYTNMCSKYFRTFRSLCHIFGKFHGYFMVNVRLQSGHLFLSIKGEWCLYVETIKRIRQTFKIVATSH